MKGIDSECNSGLGIIHTLLSVVINNILQKNKACSESRKKSGLILYCATLTLQTWLIQLMRLAVPMILFEMLGVLDPENTPQGGGNKDKHNDIKGRHF